MFEFVYIDLLFELNQHTDQSIIRIKRFYIYLLLLLDLLVLVYTNDNHDKLIIESKIK